MLIKMTDRCQMGCRHCMEDAREDGQGFITREILSRAVTLGQKMGCRVFTLSGGEPTEHPDLLALCQWLDGRLRGWGMFTVCSNGMWLADPVRREAVERITQMPTFSGMQVYTHRRWYKDYDYVTAHSGDYNAMHGIVLTVDDPIYMQDLGRARNDADAQAESERNPHFMSCLNATLAARQVSRLSDIGPALEMRGQFCRPSVSCDGSVHLSESRLCPAVGSVLTDTCDELFRRMQHAQPCGACAGYKRFASSPRPDIARARAVLGVASQNNKED